MIKKYKTRSGLPVRVLCVDAKMSKPILVLYEEDGEECFASYYQTGIRYASDQSKYDLIEVSPYEDFKTDDLCVVWNTQSGYSGFRYFSHVDEHSGKACFFSEGKTSFTYETTSAWPNCRKAAPEEIATKTIKD